MPRRFIQVTSALAAAAVVAGVPAAVFASSKDGGVYAISQSTATSTVPAYSYATYTGSVSPKGGVALADGDTVSVTLSETLPAGTTVPAMTDALFSFTPNGNPGSASTSTYQDAGLSNGDVTDGDASDGGVLKAAKTFTAATTGLTLAANGSFKFGVASSAGGTVTVDTGTSYLGGSAESKLTVQPVQSGGAAVSSLSVSPDSVTQYDHDVAPVYTVTALNASGVPVDAAVVKAAVNGVYNPAIVADRTTALATWGATGTVTFTIPESAAGAHDTITFFVEPPTTPNSNKLDPTDPQRTVSATFATPPTGISLTNSHLSVPSNPALASPTAQTLPVTVTVLDNTAAKAPVSGVRVAVEATSSVPGAPSIPRVTGVTGGDGTATLNVAVPAGEAADGTHLALKGYISGSTVLTSGDAFANTLDVSFEQRRYFVSYNGVPTQPVAGMVASVQAVAGGQVSIPLHVQDQFGEPGDNVTLGYTIASNPTNAHDRGNEKAATAITTDANGNATITYTDQAKNAATKNDSDKVVIDPVYSFGKLDANGGITLNVSYLSSLTADGTKSAWGTWSDYGRGSESDVDPNAAPAGGKASYTTVVSADPAVVQTRSAHVGYSVLLRSPDNVNLIGQKVTFSAPGAILVDPNHLDVNGNPTYGFGTLDVLTNQVGDAGVLVTSATAGDVKVTASAGSFTHTFNPISFDPDKGYNVTAVTAPSSVEPGTSVKFTYAVTDQFGNPVYGSGPDDVNPNWTYGVGSDGVLGSADDPAPVPNLAFVATLGVSTGPGTVESVSGVGTNSQFAVILKTAANDLGDGSLVVTPTSGWQASDYAPAGAPSSLSSLLVSHTSPVNGLATPFTVEDTTPAGGRAAITVKVKGKQANKGKTDVLTITVGKAAAGAKVTVLGGKKKVVAHVGAHGKLTLRIADKAPRKKNTYTVKVARTDATKAGKKKFTIK